MEQHDLRRVLDQVKTSRDQEGAMLRRLLAESKKEEQRSMKWSKKVTAVLLAAAVMLMACAFTAAMGLDQRLLSLFGAGEQEARLIEAGVVQVDQSHTYENGWTVGYQAPRSCPMTIRKISISRFYGIRGQPPIFSGMLRRFWAGSSQSLR